MLINTDNIPKYLHSSRLPVSFWIRINVNASSSPPADTVPAMHQHHSPKPWTVQLSLFHSPGNSFNPDSFSISQRHSAFASSLHERKSLPSRLRIAISRINAPEFQKPRHYPITSALSITPYHSQSAIRSSPSTTEQGVRLRLISWNICAALAAGNVRPRRSQLEETHIG